MKFQRLLISLSLGATVFSLTACNVYKGEKILLSKFAELAFPANNNNYQTCLVENYTLPVDYLSFFEIIDQQKDAIVYYGSKDCGHCETVKPSVLSYIDNTNYALSYLTPVYDFYNDEEIEYISMRVLELRGQYHNLLLTGTPQLFFIKEGQIINYILGATSTFKNKTKLANLLNSYVAWDEVYL